MLNANVSDEHLKLFFSENASYRKVLFYNSDLFFLVESPYFHLYYQFCNTSSEIYILIYNMLYNIAVSNKGTLRNFSLLEINDLCQLIETICLYQINLFRRNILISFQLLRHQFISTTYYNIFTRSIKLYVLILERH